MPHARGAHPFNYLLYAAHTRHTMRDRLPRSQCKIITDPRGRRDFIANCFDYALRDYAFFWPRFGQYLAKTWPKKHVALQRAVEEITDFKNNTPQSPHFEISNSSNCVFEGIVFVWVSGCATRATRQLHPWFQVPGSRSFLFSGSVLFVCNGRMSVNYWTGGVAGRNLDLTRAAGGFGRAREK